MSSTICFDLCQSKILSSGNGLIDFELYNCFQIQNILDIRDNSYGCSLNMEPDSPNSILVSQEHSSTFSPEFSKFESR